MKRGDKMVFPAARDAINSLCHDTRHPSHKTLCKSVERFGMKLRSLLVVAAMFFSAQSFAHEYRIGDMYIDHPYARASMPGQTSGGAYLTLENKSSSADSLVSVKTTAANLVEMHTMSMENNVMRMREISSIDLKPGEKITMQPGKSYHLMLLGLKAPLKAGDKLPLTLIFKKAGKVELAVSVEDARSAGANSQPESAHHSQ
jgi:periplasmic copper chaperone A